MAVTGIDEYRKQTGGTQEVPLPTGAVFKIRKLTGRDFMRQGNFPVSSSKDIVQAKKELTEKWLTMSAEEKREQMFTVDRIVVKAVVEPLISLEMEKDKLCIHEIKDPDYYALIKAITAFCMGGEALKPFRTEQSTTGTGRDGAEVPSASAPIIEPST